MGQLQSCFPRDQGQTLLSNTTKIFFACNDYQTAEFLSKSLGNETILVEGGGASSNWGGSSSSSYGGTSGQATAGKNWGGGSSSDWRQQSRELLRPDEILALNPRIAITQTPGVRPLWTTLIRYYEEKALLRHRGLLARLAGAVWTLCLSALLLGAAAVAAKAMSDEWNGSGGRFNQPPVPAFRTPPAWPAARPGVGR